MAIPFRNNAKMPSLSTYFHPNDIYVSAVLSDSKPESTSEGSPQSTVFPSGYEVRISL